MNSQKLIQIQTTTDSKDSALKIAQNLIESHLAACVQIVGPLTSVYRWKNKIETSEEYLLLIKTIANNYPLVQNLISSIHPYEVPEIIALDISAVNPEYLSWCQDECKTKD